MSKTYLLYKPSQRRFNDLHFCFCGYEACDPLHSFGPSVRSNYLIHYILSGKGIYSVDNNVYHLQAGKGFLIEPGVQTFYQADAEEPWSYIWVGFDGEFAPEFMRKMGLGGAHLVFSCPHGKELEDIVFEMLRHNRAQDADELMIESLLYRFLAQMSRDVSVEVPDTAEGNEYVRKAIEYIQTNYMRPIRVHDIAEHVNINRGYLYALFKKEMNMSPQEYLTNLRLTRAAEQLNTTNTPVEQIAQANGYNDPVVFSKAFKKMHGTSPSRYRQNTADKSRDSMKLKESGKDTLQ